MRWYDSQRRRVGEVSLIGKGFCRKRLILLGSAAISHPDEMVHWHLLFRHEGRHFEKTVILQAVRWYLSYALSCRDIEELFAKQGVCIDHSTFASWVVRHAPLLEKAFRRTKRKPGDSWRMDETYLKVRGQWKYLHRAVDTCGETVDFLPAAKRDAYAVYRLSQKACAQKGKPRVVTVDGRAANRGGIADFNENHRTRIEVRQKKYLNNLIEQDHRRIKRKVRPMLGFKSFRSASATIAGIELIHQLRKRQNKNDPDRPLCEQFQRPYCVKKSLLSSIEPRTANAPSGDERRSASRSGPTAAGSASQTPSPPSDITSSDWLPSLSSGPSSRGSSRKCAKPSLEGGLLTTFST